MKIEIRTFKEIRHLLLIPETDREVSTLDNYFGDDVSHFQNKRITETLLCTSNDWKPYIRVESPHVS